MGDNVKCCNHNCNEGRDCQLRKEQMQVNIAWLLVMLVVFVISVALLLGDL